jgi:peptidoglycan/xylan/chitin deacetylase (PgdA/CDA1 family)
MRTLTRTLALSRTRRPVTWWYPYISDPAVETYAGQAILSMTYDDGRLDNYTTALLLHEKYKIPATFFIIGDRMGWTREAAIAANYMHTLEVQNTHRRGIEIGSHSYSHPTLTELDAAEIAYEFSESKSVRGFVDR